MTSKILYFTAGQYPTTEELADIQKLNDAAEQPYSVNVMNAAADVKYGPLLKDCDYVAGSVPEPYSEVATIDPDNLPVQGLKSTQAVVNSGQTYNVTGGTVTLTVADNAVTATFTATP